MEHARVICNSIDWYEPMLKNYLKIALRNLRRYAGYSFISITGLAVGIACCGLLMLYVQHEMSFDRFHERAQQIYRVSTMESDEGNMQHRATSPIRLSPALREDFPEVVEAIRIRPYSSRLVAVEDARFTEERSMMADASLFEAFSFPLVKGNPATALTAPFSVVISESLAAKYFGKEDPFGQTLTIDQYDYRITGILEEIPPNSHLQFDFVVSWSTWRALRGDEHMDEIEQRWQASTLTYILLAASSSPAALEEKLTEYVNQRVEDPELLFQFRLQPLTSIYLHSNLAYETRTTGDLTQIYLLSAIAFFILLLACINFVNLTTARSVRRAREVGVRKVTGAYREQLIRQFLGESLLISVIALLLAMALVELFLPTFNVLVQKELATDYRNSLAVVLGLVGLTLFVGIAAGSYPAFFLSRFNPVQVLKGSLGTSSRSLLRKVLVVFQFAVSIVLIAGTLVVQNQLAYISDKQLGFDKEHIVVIRSRDFRAFSSQYGAFKQEVLKHPNIQMVTASTAMGALGALAPLPTAEEEHLNARWIGVDYDYIETLGMKLAAGRSFSRGVASDAREAFILNIAAVQAFGWNRDTVVGTTFRFNGREATVIGIVEDFHSASLHERIEPTVLYISRTRPYISVKIDPEDIAGTLSYLSKTWQTFAPDWPFEYSFLDEEVDKLYRAEQRFGQFFRSASFLAIVIACLGLFGLAAFMAEQHTKEIGIRKVLGASTSSIVMLLSNDFIKLVGVAFVVATPIAYLAMNQWLEGFVYRVETGVSVFVLAGSLALLIALLTVSYQSIRAALADPVESLRYD